MSPHGITSFPSVGAQVLSSLVHFLGVFVGSFMSENTNLVDVYQASLSSRTASPDVWLPSSSLPFKVSRRYPGHGCSSFSSSSTRGCSSSPVRSAYSHSLHSTLRI